MSTTDDLLDLERDSRSLLPLLTVHPASSHDVYLSPHYDDICFSLGSHVLERGKGVLLGVFSRSKYLGNSLRIRATGLDGLSPELQIDRVSAIRRAEDFQFAAEVGLRPFYCGLDEAPVRGRHPFAAEFAVEDTRQFSPVLMGWLRTFASGVSDDRPALYCPLAIGAHLDHLVVRNTVLDHLSELRDIYTLYFYEDLHYASNCTARQAGLRDIFARLCPLTPRRLALPVSDFRRKVRLLEIYSSQFPALPPNPLEFTPWTGIPSYPAHEALWML